MRQNGLCGALLSVLLSGTPSLFAAEVVYTQSTLMAQDGYAYVTAEGKGSLVRGADGWFVYTPSALADNEKVTLVVEMTNITFRAYNQFWVEVDNSNAAAALQFALDRALPQWDEIETTIGLFPSGKSTVMAPIEGFASPGKVRRARMVVRHKTTDYPSSVITGTIRFRMRLRLTDYKLQTHLWDKLPAALSTALPSGLSASAQKAGEAKRAELAAVVAALKTKAMSASTSNADKIAAFESLFYYKDRAGRLIQQAALLVDAKAAEAKGAFLVGVISGVDKVSRDDIFAGNLGGMLSLSVARGEAEGLQAVLYSTTDQPGVRATISDLVTANGDRLDATCLSVHPVGYVKPTYPAYVPPTRFQETIADPILEWTASTDLFAERFQPYWIEAKIPEGVKPGLYEGSVSFVAAGGFGVSVPLTVKVRRMTLNRLRKLPVVFSSGVYTAKSSLQVVYEQDDAVLGELEKFLSSEGGDPSILSVRVRAAWDRMEQEHRLLVSHNIPIQNIYSSPSIVQPKWIRDIRLKECPSIFTIGYDKVSPVVDVVGKQVAALGEASSSIWFYGYDEVSTADAYAAMKKSFGAVKAAYPQVHTFCTALDGTFGVKSDCLTEVDAWVDPEDRYTGHASAAANARARGKQVWYYPCNWPVVPYANFHLENTAVASRVLTGLAAWKKRTDGILYYSVDTFTPYVDTPVLSYGFNEFSGGAKKTRHGNNGYDVDVTISTSSSATSGKAERWESFAENFDILPPVRIRGEVYVDNFTKSTGSGCYVELRFNYKNKALADNGQEQNFFNVNVGKLGSWQTIDMTVTPKGEAVNCLFRVYAKSSKAKVIFRNMRVEAADGHLTNRKVGVSAPLPENTVVFDNACYGSFRSNGDGALLYPGPTGPSASLRLKCIRDGIDDYEYLAQLNAAVESVNSGELIVRESASFLSRAEAALAIPSDVCSSFTSYAGEGAPLVAWREEAGDLIDEALAGRKPRKPDGRLYESFENFTGASGASVVGFKGDDDSGAWSRSGNVIVLKDGGDVPDGWNCLRIADTTSAQHSVTKSIDAAYRPRIPYDGSTSCAFAFSFRRLVANESASLTGCKLKLTAVSPSTGETIAMSDGADICAAPSAVKDVLSAGLGVWFRVTGHVAIETPSAGKRRLALRVNRIENRLTGEILLDSPGAGTYYTYKDVTSETDDFVLSGFTFFTYSSGQGLIEFDEFLIGSPDRKGFTVTIY